MKNFKSFLSNEEAATAIEYGLIVAIISIAAIIASQMAGDQIVASFNTISSALSSSTP